MAKTVTKMKKADDGVDKLTRQRALTFATKNFVSVPIVERDGQLHMLTITDRQPGDTLVAVIHPRK